jgi:hypothetical protein
MSKSKRTLQITKVNSLLVGNSLNKSHDVSIRNRLQNDASRRLGLFLSTKSPPENVKLTVLSSGSISSSSNILLNSSLVNRFPAFIGLSFSSNSA